MAQQDNKPPRIRLKSLTDLQRQHAVVYRECKAGILADGKAGTLSMILKRMYDSLIAAREIDVSEQLADLEQQLFELESKR